MKFSNLIFITGTGVIFTHSIFAQEAKSHKSAKKDSKATKPPLASKTSKSSKWAKTASPSSSPSASPTGGIEDPPEPKTIPRTTIEVDASATWNSTCPLTDPVADAEILAKSFYDSMGPLLNGDLQSVNVYELCGEAVVATPYPPSGRRLQSGQSEIKFITIVTSTCNDCDNQMYQETDEALDS